MALQSVDRLDFITASSHGLCTRLLKQRQQFTSYSTCKYFIRFEFPFRLLLLFFVVNFIRIFYCCCFSFFVFSDDLLIGEKTNDSFANRRIDNRKIVQQNSENILLYSISSVAFFVVRFLEFIAANACRAEKSVPITLEYIYFLVSNENEKKQKKNEEIFVVLSVRMIVYV